jgi:hypothetical protein
MHTWTCRPRLDVVLLATLDDYASIPHAGDCREYNEHRNLPPCWMQWSTLFKLSNNRVQWFQRSIYKTRDIDRHYVKRFLSWPAISTWALRTGEVDILCQKLKPTWEPQATGTSSTWVYAFHQRSDGCDPCREQQKKLLIWFEEFVNIISEHTWAVLGSKYSQRQSNQQDSILIYIWTCWYPGHVSYSRKRRFSFENFGNK